MGQMQEICASEYRRVAPLFEAYDYDHPMFGCVLEGNQPGRVFCDALDRPGAALVCHPAGDSYLAGDPAGVDLRAFFEEGLSSAGLSLKARDFFAPRGSAWFAREAEVFEDRISYGGYRYFEFAGASMDVLRNWRAAVPEGMAVCRMDRKLAARTQAEFGVPLDTYWGSLDRFLDRGFGFVAVTAGGDLVSMVDLFALGKSEAEIEIATKRAYRRRGLGTLAACAFIEHSLAEGFTPTWACELDNTPSACMAQSLGFRNRFSCKTFSLAPEDET